MRGKAMAAADQLAAELEAAPLPDAKPKPKAEKTQPVTIRLPESVIARYVGEAARRSIEAGRTVTAQAVMVELLAGQAPPNG